MKWTNGLLIGLSIFFGQFFLAELTTIRLVRPDFVAIGVLYMAIRYGRFFGVLFGFSLGLAVDFAGVGSFFGLTPLTCSLTGYLGGYLKGKYERFVPLRFYASIGLIFCMHFLIFTYVRYQSLIESDLGVFWSKWFFTALYSSIVLLIVNYFYPLREAARAES